MEPVKSIKDLNNETAVRSGVSAVGNKKVDEL